ncbi:MAG: cytochrome c family protein [Planctomycetales bacterium]|nr:cytochrome c family protein [Planctomycetales bacterium]
MLCLMVFAAPTFAEELTDLPVCDPAKVLTDDKCNKCHQQEIDQWRGTPHYRTFDSLHRKPEAKEIADKLGLRSVKRNDTCVRCHYTQQEKNGRPRVVAGVSCESCHGAAQDWVDIHADYGGQNVTKQQETPEHKRERREKSIRAGMNNPSNLYLIARQCLGCHTAPDEKLVNVGGHNAGSEGFELVSWSQGFVRHNFQRTDGQSNALSNPDRLRVMYLVGLMADLEFSLRAVAKATSGDRYGTTAAERAARVKQRLWQAQRVLKNQQLGQALDAVSEVKLTLDNAEAINQAADKVGKVALEFSKESNGATLEAIDPLLPTPEQYKQ